MDRRLWERKSGTLRFRSASSPGAAAPGATAEGPDAAPRAQRASRRDPAPARDGWRPLRPGATRDPRLATTPRWPDCSFHAPRPDIARHAPTGTHRTTAESLTS